MQAGMVDKVVFDCRVNNVMVYNLEVVNRVSGAFVLRIYRQLSPYIEIVKKKQPKAYEDSELLARNL